MGYFTYLYMAYIGVITYNPLFLTFDTNLLGHPSSEDEHFKRCVLPCHQLKVNAQSLEKE